jgi:dCMP deaminase
MKQKWVDAFMDTAERFAQLSSAVRLQVGAVVVKDNRIISIGYNGMPSGWTNECETKIYCDDGDSSEQQLPKDANVWKKYKLVTKDEVIHAEANAIIKLARDGESGNGSSLFCTHAPCIHCAKLIHGAGIDKVYYRHSYRDEDGVSFLQKCKINVEKVDFNSIVN